MTRLKPTDAEVELERIMLAYLRSSGARVEILPRNSADKPDLAFTFNAKVVACECVQIPPAEVFQWVHRRFPLNPGEPYCYAVIWAEEPHSWVREAIKSKINRVDEYRGSVSADEVWLLVHTPTLDEQIFVRGDFAWEAQMLRYGASVEKHSFDRVYFWEPRSGVQLIHQPGQVVPRVKFDFSKGYPSRSFVMFGGYPFATTKEGEPPKTYTYDTIRPKLIIVPPIDPEFGKHSCNFRGRTYRMTIEANATDAKLMPKIEWDNE